MGFISTPGPLEILVILAIALVVLGPGAASGGRAVGRPRHARAARVSTAPDPDPEPYDEPDDLAKNAPPNEGSAPNTATSASAGSYQKDAESSWPRAPRSASCRRRS